MKLKQNLTVGALLLLACSTCVWGEENIRGEKSATVADTAEAEYQAGLSGYLRGVGTENYSLGDSAFESAKRDRLLVSRLQPYIFWKPLDYLALRVEGQGYWNRDDHKTDDFRAELYQAYFDVSSPGSEMVSLRVGRQEFGYGSGFILANDAFNDGISYDALRLRIKPFAPLSVDLLGGRYASHFVDGRKGDLAALYATYSLNDSTAFDLYSIRDTGSEGGSTKDPLYIWGGRLTTKLGPVSVEAEPVYETGRLADGSGKKSNINAYGGHLDLTVENDWQGFKNKVFLGYALGSGSQDAVNGVAFNKEFRHQNSNASFSELISVVGDLSGLDAGGNRASGMQSYSLGFGVDIKDGLNFTVNNHLFRAMEVPAGFSKNIGFETTSYLTWSPAEQVSVILAYTHLFSGKFFSDATGSSRDADIAYLQLQFDLAKKSAK